MVKKISLTLVFAMLLSSLCIFTGCKKNTESKGTDLDEVFASEIDNSIKSAELIKNDISGNLVAASGKLAMTLENIDSSTKIYRVYNIELEDSLLRTYTNPENIGLLSSQSFQEIPYATNYDKRIEQTQIYPDSNFYDIFAVSINGKTRICNADGSVVCELDSEQASLDGIVFYSNNYFGINKIIYEIRDGLAVATSMTSLASFLECNYHYLNMSYAVTDKSATVYDDKNFPICTYNIPSYAKSSKIFVMYDGNLLAQYIVEATDSNNFNLVIDNVKYQLFTVKVIVKENKTENLDINYMLNSVTNEITNKNYYSYANTKMKNLAYGFKIQDKRYDENATYMLNIDADINITEMFNTGLYSSMKSITPITSNRFILELTDGTYLIDRNGVMKGTANNIKANTSKYIITDTTLFDLEPEIVADLTDYIYVTNIGDTILVKRSYISSLGVTDYTYYIFVENSTGGSFKQIATKDAEFVGVIYNGLVAAYTTSGELRYYNSNGESIITTSKKIMWLESSNENYILGYSYDEKAPVPFSYYVVKNYNGTDTFFHSSDAPDNSSDSTANTTQETTANTEVTPVTENTPVSEANTPTK